VLPLLRLDAETGQSRPTRLAIRWQKHTLFTLTAGRRGGVSHTGRDTALVAGIVRVSVGGGEERTGRRVQRALLVARPGGRARGIQPANTTCSCLFRKSVTVSESPVLEITTTVTVSASDGLVFWSKSVTRRQMGWWARTKLVAGPLYRWYRDTGVPVSSAVRVTPVRPGRDALSAFMGDGDKHCSARRGARGQIYL